MMMSRRFFTTIGKLPDLTRTWEQFADKQKPAIKGYNLLIRQPPIRNLVFEGGGPRGLAYIGAIQALERKGTLKSVENIGGSSAGAITALALGLGYNSYEIKDIAFDASLADFMDISDNAKNLNWLQKAYKGFINITRKSGELGRGLYLGKSLQKWVQDCIHKKMEIAYIFCSGEISERKDFVKTMLAHKGSITFRELQTIREYFPELNIKNICLTGTNYTDQKLEVFSIEKTPDMPIDVAVRISMSIPWAFKSVMYNGKEYVDGGCLNNYPMEIFDKVPYLPEGPHYIGEYGQNLQTLGIRVDNETEIKEILWKNKKGVSFLAGFKRSLAKFFVGVDYIGSGDQIDKDTYEKYPHRTIQIFDEGLKLLDFNMGQQDKEELLQSGRNASEDYIDVYLNEDTALSIRVDSLQELKPYISKEEIEKFDEQLKGELYVLMEKDTLMKDIPWDYIKDEINKQIRKETQKALENNSAWLIVDNGENIYDSLDKHEIEHGLREKVYRILNDSLNRAFSEILEKEGISRENFKKIIFSVLELSGTDAPVTKIMSGIVDAPEEGQSSYLENVIKETIAQEKIHSLNQDANAIQKEIEKQTSEIESGKRKQEELNKKAKELQEKINTASEKDKPDLERQEQETNAQISEIKQELERQEKERGDTEKEKERRETESWKEDKAKEQEEYERKQKEAAEKANQQEKHIFLP